MASVRMKTCLRRGDFQWPTKSASRARDVLPVRCGTCVPREEESVGLSSGISTGRSILPGHSSLPQRPLYLRDLRGAPGRMSSVRRLVRLPCVLSFGPWCPQMMRNLLLDEGGLVQVENVSLSVATFAKFQPQAPDFLDITNPKAVLENALRNFACLSQGDVVAIKYNDKVYELCVLETKPGKAVSIIECDMNVDFAPPVGYQEPQRQGQTDEGKTEADGQPMETGEDEDARFRPFIGQGNRLDGKKKGTESSPQPQTAFGPRRGIPNYNHKRGTITFIRNSRPVTNGNSEETDKSFEAFSGEGQSLRRKSRNFPEELGTPV